MPRPSPVTSSAQLDGLLGLVAAYQRFYGARAPDDARNRSFFARFVPPGERGMMLGLWEDGAPAGFATLYWTYSSTRACEVALLNDLFVAEDRRGAGHGRALLGAAADAARERGLPVMEWQTAPDNAAAQRLYDRTGAGRSTWLTYELSLARRSSSSTKKS